MMRLGDYELIEEIGRGGAGVVYRARAKDGRAVAVKILVAARDLDRTRRELRLLGELGEAKGFVPVLDAGLSPQGCYIVMPFLAGGTLRDKLRRGPLEIEGAVELGKTLARALGEAHARGIVHRDLKPENILFSDDGRPFVADLGLAKHYRRDGPGGAMSLSLSQGGGFRGTFGYAPPEQLRDSKEVGPAGDVFALGAILYECLAGAPAFSGETPFAILDLVESGSHGSLEKARSGLPRSLVAAIERALSPDPKERFADGAELVAALDARPSRSRLPTAIALGLVAVAGLAFAFVPRAGPETPRAPERLPLPELCSGFAHGKILVLEQVLGDYAWKTSGPIQALAWSRDGKLVLSAQGHWMGGEKVQWDYAYDKTVAVWEARTGREIARFKGHTHGVMACAFVGSGSVACSGSWDGTLRFWETTTGRELAKLELGAPVRSIAVARDVPLVCAGLEDGRVVDVDPDAGTVIETHKAHTGAVLSLVVSEDGKRRLSGSADGGLRSWEEGQLGSFKALTKAVRALLLEPDGAIFGDDAGVISKIDRKTGEVETVEKTGSAVRGFARAKGGIVSVHADGSVRRGRMIDHRAAPLWAVAASPDGERVIWAGADSLIAEEGRVPHSACRLAVSRDGTLLASTGPCGTLRLRDAASGKALWTVKASDKTVFKVALSPDARLVATAGEDGDVRLWDARAGDPVRALSKHPGTVYDVAFSPDGKRLASCGDHGKTYLWDLSTGDPRELVGPTLGAFCVTWQPDGRQLLSCGLDKAIRFWDPSTAAETRRIDDAHGDLVGHLALSPGARKLLSQAWDGTLKVWDLEKRALIRQLPRAPRVCWPGAFVDERRAVVGCYDGTIEVWDTDSGELLEKLSLASSTDTPITIEPSPDRRSVLVATGRGVILKFRLGS